jgi:hypothetical protein
MANKRRRRRGKHRIQEVAQDTSEKEIPTQRICQNKLRELSGQIRQGEEKEVRHYLT